jgi:hypothetical protein
VARGQTATYTVTVSSTGGFAGQVTLTVKGLPTTAATSWHPNPVVAPGSTVLTIGTAAMPRRSYTLRIIATCGARTRRTTATLVVR